MEQAGGRFAEGFDHSIARHAKGSVLGGFVFSDYMGNAIAVHMAGQGRWCSRTLMWMAFDYGFNQLGCAKLVAPVPSDNYKAMELDLRAGWFVEAVLRDVVKSPDGRVASLFLLTMTRASCPWLNVRSRSWERVPNDMSEAL